MLKNKKRVLATAEKERLSKIAEEEARFGHLPAWKRRLIEKKSVEKDAIAEVERLKQNEIEMKNADIAAMPEWKRKLFLEKNPEYA